MVPHAGGSSSSSIVVVERAGDALGGLSLGFQIECGQGWHLVNDTEDSGTAQVIQILARITAP